MTTDRERFCAVLASGPLRRADAVVELAGEDGLARVEVALQLFRQRAAPTLVFSGGPEDPPHLVGARALAALATGRGVAPDRIIVESASTNSAEQAKAVVAMAKDKGWTNLLLVASGYHQFRAFLTFLRALQRAELADTVRLTVVPTSQAPWGQAPPGCEATRLALLDGEFAKVEAYGDDVATWADGLAYLLAWESR